MKKKKKTSRPNPVWAFARRRASALLGIALAALLIHDVFGEHGFLAMRRARMEAEKLQQEIQQINADNARLAEEVQALKNDPRIIERIAREEMGLARPGELIFKLPPKLPEAAKEPPQK
jgi:cell division protein FtsB